MDFLFLAGRIRALQSKLLTQSQIERMIGAETAADAFRVFSELQYADYISTENTIDNFENVIDQGLKETKELIVSGTDNAVEFEFIWKPFDVNNIKRALKEKLVDGASDIVDFSAENGYELLGALSKDVLEKVIFEDEVNAAVPFEIANLLPNIASVYAEHSNFQTVEFLLDNALFSYLQRLAKETKSDFLKKFAIWQIDRANLKTKLRVLSLNQELNESLFLKGGTLSLEVFLQSVSVDSFANFLLDNDFLTLGLKIKQKKFESEALLLLELEKLIELETTEMLMDAEDGEIGSIQIPLVYFVKRIKNARILKFVMYAKIYGLAPEKIYETIKHF